MRFIVALLAILSLALANEWNGDNLTMNIATGGWNIKDMPVHKNVIGADFVVITDYKLNVDFNMPLDYVSSIQTTINMSGPYPGIYSMNMDNKTVKDGKVVYNFRIPWYSFGANWGTSNGQLYTAPFLTFELVNNFTWTPEYKSIWDSTQAFVQVRDGYWDANGGSCRGVYASGNNKGFGNMVYPDAEPTTILEIQCCDPHSSTSDNCWGTTVSVSGTSFNRGYLPFGELGYIPAQYLFNKDHMPPVNEEGFAWICYNDTKQVVEQVVGTSAIGTALNYPFYLSLVGQPGITVYDFDEGCSQYCVLYSGYIDNTEANYNGNCDAPITD